MSCILGAASCEFDIMLAGLDDFFSVWNPYVKMHNPYVTNNMLVEKIGVQKCTSKLRTPVTPIVGRTSERCLLRLHVCAYVHSGGFCSKFDVCSEWTTTVHFSYASPHATVWSRRRIVGHARQPFHFGWSDQGISSHGYLLSIALPGILQAS